MARAKTISNHGGKQDMKMPYGVPRGSGSKEAACSVADPVLISRLGRSPGGGRGNPVQCSCLENPQDRGAWWAIVHGVAESQTGLSD